MAFLQYSDIQFQYNFQMASSFLNRINRRLYAQGPTTLGGGAVNFMESPTDVNAQYVDTDRGYRDSYGGYYHCAEDTDHMFTTVGSSPLKVMWELASFTYGFVFRDTSTSSGNRYLMSKPTTAFSGSDTPGIELLVDGNDDFKWEAGQDIDVPDVAIITSFEKNTWYIGYVIKADGVKSKIGLKKKGSNTWVTVEGNTANSVDYDNTKDAGLMGRINTVTIQPENPFLGDIQRFCCWKVAITESTVQSSLEDHFGKADTVTAVQRSAILS